MNEEEKIVKYWRKKVRECFDDAKLLLENKRLFSANRIYYTLFYQVSALLLAKGLSFSKHSRVLAAFNRELFVKTGIIDKELDKFYNRMFEYRKSEDYRELVEFEEEDVRKWLKTAEKFLDVIDKWRRYNETH